MQGFSKDEENLLTRILNLSSNQRQNVLVLRESGISLSDVIKSLTNDEIIATTLARRIPESCWRRMLQEIDSS